MTDLLDPTICPSYGSDEQEAWDTLVLTGDTGIVQVRGIRTVPRWMVSYVWERPLDANLDTIQAFFRTQKGPQTAFYAYTVNLWRWWPDVAAGTGTGTELNFFFPGRHSETGTAIVKVDSSATTYFTLDLPSDANKRGRIVFTAGHAPGNGLAVTISFRGQRLLLGRLVKDATTSVSTFRQLKVTADFSGEEQ